MTRPFDRTDCALLNLLQRDGRKTNKEIAAALDVAPSTALARTRRLEEDGVVRGYHADVDPRAVGATLQALVAVTLKQHARPLVEAFQVHALALPEVVQLFHTAGAGDFLVHVAVRDAEHLRDLALTGFTERPEVARIVTTLLFAHHRSAGLPIYRAEPGAITGRR